MQYRFVTMNEKYAHEIAFDWKYSDIYSFYDMTADEEDLQEFLHQDNWNDEYFAVVNEENQLVGFYSFSFDDGIMWIGFGLKPELTGMGIGKEFVIAGINFGVENFNYRDNYIMLGVALFNKRAIKLYENIGFIPVEEYIQKTNSGEYEFIKMKKYL
ncbi:MAG: family N-acetyltransferase, partial [Clostridiales bacterium]|nr:family N-acetyltransferase [Clostridiales bacterium]